MTFWQALRSSYGRSLAFCLAFPAIIAIPILVELIQHVIEWHLGFYDSVAAARAVEHHPLRMGFGLAKVFALYIPAYYVPRFLARDDRGFVTRWDAVALRLFAAVLVFNMVFSAIGLFLVPATGTAQLISFVVGTVLGTLLMAWATAAALGNAKIGPLASMRLMGRHFVWSFVFGLVAMLGGLIPHYVFGALALLGPHALKWPVLIIDSLLVGWLAALLAAIAYYATARAAARSGVPLLPDAQSPRAASAMA